MSMKVSACMAVHNGDPYLRGQIESILAQLRHGDEIVAVDDCSQDRSLAVLNEVADPRLRVYRNEKNLGVVRTFEKALGLCTGDIIFLSDQDDLWLAGKLSAALQVFASRPEVTMVATDAAVIDENGLTVAPSFFAQRGRFAPGALHNFVKNKYLGCTLSFRCEMLALFLPIPPDVPMHDIWFGLLNAIYGKTYFIDEPLIAYRRHGRNASPRVHAGFGQMLLWRSRLAKNLVRRVASHGLRR
jgi:glycosyltransferase involved in cell wall biosynthesis